jgi:ssRNA-specific RNase YbeY (16S rRNA maturation enzyme)
MIEKQYTQLNPYKKPCADTLIKVSAHGFLHLVNDSI